MKKQYKIDAGFDISITVEVDLDKLTPELAAEINSFWSGSKDILAKSNGDIIVAAVRRSAPYLISPLLEGYNELGAQDRLDESEGWPENHGIKLIDFEIPEFGAYDVDVTELSA
jgi:hypothetical protein